MGESPAPPLSDLTNTVNIPEMTAAMISASVYRPSCFSGSITGARYGTPRDCPGRSVLNRWITLRRPVLPNAGTTVQVRDAFR